MNDNGSQSPAEPISWIWIGWRRPTLGNWQKGRPTHLMLITELLDIQFQIQFLITYSSFLLVNILLQLFDIWSQKGNEKERNTVNKKQEKNVKKVYVNIKHSVHWVINLPLPQNHHPTLSCQAPLKSKIYPSLYIVFCEHPPKSRIFLWIPDISPTYNPKQVFHP